MTTEPKVDSAPDLVDVIMRLLVNYPTRFTDEAQMAAEQATPAYGECLGRINPHSSRWDHARAALFRAAWESGWDAALDALHRTAPDFVCRRST